MADESTMEVVAVATIVGGQGEERTETKPGDTVSLPEKQAQRLIDLGLAAKPKDLKSGDTAGDNPVSAAVGVTPAPEPAKKSRSTQKTEE